VKEDYKLNYKATIEVDGNDLDDIDIALEEIRRLIAEGFITGSDRNESGKYYFTINKEENI